MLEECGVGKKEEQCNVAQGKEISNWQKVGLEGGGRKK